MDNQAPKKVSTERKLLNWILTTSVLLIITAVLTCNVHVAWLGIHYQEAVSISGAKVGYFDITGHSWNEWQVTTRKFTAGKNMDGALAWTDWGISGNWRCNNNIIDSMSVSVKITVNLPRADMQNASLFELSQWERYLDALVKHESHHVEIVNGHLVDFQRINGMDCETGKNQYGTIYQNIIQLNKDYDVEHNQEVTRE